MVIQSENQRHRLFLAAFALVMTVIMFYFEQRAMGTMAAVFGAGALVRFFLARRRGARSRGHP
jgi:hypothetical protein